SLTAPPPSGLYTLSLHDALPILVPVDVVHDFHALGHVAAIWLFEDGRRLPADHLRRRVDVILEQEPQFQRQRLQAEYHPRLGAEGAVVVDVQLHELRSRQGFYSSNRRSDRVVSHPAQESAPPSALPYP